MATGAAEDAAAAYARLLAEADRHGLDDERATALLGLGHCALETGDLPTAREHFEVVERLLADAPLPLRAPAVRGRAVAHLLAGELRYACYLLESAIDELNTSGLQDPGALLLLYTAAIAPYMDMGAHARAAQAGELALALAPRVSDPELVAGLHRSVARTLIAAGRTAEADASLAKAAEIYQQLQIRTELAHCHWMRGYVHAQDGDLSGAETELRAARDMLASKRASLYTAQVEVELADVLRRRGKTAQAQELLHRLLGELHPDRGSVHAGGAHRLLGLIHEDRGDLEIRRGALRHRAVPAGTCRCRRRPRGHLPAAGRPAAPRGPHRGRDGRLPNRPRPPGLPRHHHTGPVTGPATHRLIPARRRRARGRRAGRGIPVAGRRRRRAISFRPVSIQRLRTPPGMSDASGSGRRPAPQGEEWAARRRDGRGSGTGSGRGGGGCGIGSGEGPGGTGPGGAGGGSGSGDGGPGIGPGVGAAGPGRGTDSSSGASERFGVDLLPPSPGAAGRAW